jgi:hypothetical protein
MIHAASSDNNSPSTCNANDTATEITVTMKRLSVSVREDLSATKIRSRYLHRLGFTDGRVAPTNGKASFRHGTRSVEPKASILRKRQRRDGPALLCVSFARQVVSSIKSVPSRDAYPTDVCDALWMRGEKYQRMVQKNIIEFISEGCKPDQVLEEENFILYRYTLVHPAHLLVEL